MNLIKKSLGLVVVASLAVVAHATDVTTLNGTQGWSVSGASGGGAASLGTAFSSDADGSLQLNGDRIRVQLGYGDTIAAPLVNYGTLAALASGSMSFDFFRSSTSMTNDNRYNVAVKLFLGDGRSLTWENGYNASLTDSDVWHRDYAIGGSTGKWFVRESGTSYTDGGQQYTLAQYVGGQTATTGGKTSTPISGSLSIVGVSFAIGSGISAGTGTFVGAADNLKLNFVGGNQYAYNFSAQPVPEPSAFAALGLGAVALLRRRKKA